jgi:hypothetical protein
MTDLALQPPGAAPWLRSAAGGTAQAALATYRLGGRALVAAPLLIAIAVVPELAQHIAEISLGMFDSREAFHAGAGDPLRWAFAYPKVIGFVLATLAIARFWALGSVRAALLIRPSALLRVILAFALTLIAEQAFAWLKAISNSPGVDELLGGGSLLVQVGLLVLLVAALVEDRATGLRAAFTSRWPTALLIILLAALAFLPTQAAHSFHHMAALGQPAPLVWALMIWDSLWVGLMAALVGSALFVGYRAGPTWRGWTVNPRMIG